MKTESAAEWCERTTPRCAYCRKQYKFVGMLYVPMCECEENNEAIGKGE